jgi:hypothetical protein
MMRLEGLDELKKKSITSSGFEIVTFHLVAQRPINYTSVRPSSSQAQLCQKSSVGG